jgi:aspartyl-tRNA(Asn)/glutamyl-tRNA(Gln) amidotransferase subunit A
MVGLPVVSVPSGFTSTGLPLGIQIAGRPFAERTILEAAAAYEAATDWTTRRPPVD